MSQQNYPIETDPQTVQQWLEGKEVVLVDCREQDEYDTAKIEGAVLMPMSDWNESAEKLSGLEGQKLVVHCHHGVRSLRVVHWLRQNGFPDAISMRGGIDAWSREVDPNVPTY